jgi:hypothetical protein
MHDELLKRRAAATLKIQPQPAFFGLDLVLDVVLTLMDGELLTLADGLVLTFGGGTSTSGAGARGRGTPTLTSTRMAPLENCEGSFRLLIAFLYLWRIND